MWYYYLLAAALLILNMFFFWYIRQLLSKFLFISRNLSNLQYNLGMFTSHLEKVHKMEIFYGEPVIEKLLQHSREIVENVGEFAESFDFEEGEDLVHEWEWEEEQEIHEEEITYEEKE